MQSLFYLGGVALVYKSKKIIATFLAIFTTIFSICSSAVIVSADNAFWDYMIGGVEFLRELTGLTFDFSNSMLDTGFKLGEQLDKALKEGESNGLDYGGAYYNKESNMFYLKKDSDNNVYINQNFYEEIYKVAEKHLQALNGYYLFTPSNGFTEVHQYVKSALLSSYAGINNDKYAYINSNIFDKELHEFLCRYNNVVIPCYAGKDGQWSSKPHLFALNVSGFDSRFYPVCEGSYGAYNGIYCYKKDTGFDKRFWAAFNTIEISGDVGNFKIVEANDSDEYTSRMLFSILQNSFSRNTVYGKPFRIFYSKQDLQNFWNNGRHYVPKIKIDNTIKIPKDLLDNKKLSTVINNYYNDIDKSNKTETEIQDSFNNTITNYFNQFTDGEDKPATPTPTPTPKPGSGGDIGDGTTPTPTPPITDGGDDSGNGKIDLKEITDLLKQILEKLTFFTESHTKFEKTITDYIEANDGKLDQIIEAINALSDGKTEDEKNGCKYDFTALSDFMTKLWNKSDKKFDKMVELLEENNKYQKKLVNSLNEIKAILVTQTIMDVFQDRSQQTAEKAKDKFPTSLPWDIALVVNVMSAEPEKPQFDLPIQIKSLNINEEIHVDLASGEWEKLAKTCRYLLSILFILLLVQLSRKLFSNGGND